jgi:outer membrane protein TolC
VPIEHIVVWEMELKKQRRYRREGAAAALSRTDWDIAFQEQITAVLVIRAYVALLYRQEKLRLIDQTRTFNEQLVENVRRLVNLGKLRNADLIVAQTEVTDTLDVVASGWEALTAARQDLFRVLGVVRADFDIEGALDAPPVTWDAAALSDMALTRRADLQARRSAVSEAGANVRLVTANRWGNPSIGPAFTYDPSSVSQIGIQINVPIPVATTHRGEVYQSQAEYTLATLQLRQAEIDVQQDVATALARLEVAERRADLFRTRTLPDLKKAAEDMQKLFIAGDPTLDLLRVVDVRRKLLKARDSYLDALWGVRQARIDVLAATGEPTLALTNPAVAEPAAPPRP